MFTTIICIGVATAAILVIGTVIREQRRFEEEFPPISDEEFVARCSPGTSPDVALRVRRIIAESVGLPYEHIHPSMSFVDDLWECN